MYGIALDLGTSGFRLQLLDLSSGDVIKTVMTMRHPLPGGNVIDHLGFAVQVGEDCANNIVVHTVRKMISELNVPIRDIKRIAVCGNPIQLSIFQNIEIRDLAYAGKNMQKRLGIGNIKRGLVVYPGQSIFKNEAAFEGSEVIVLPSIEHEIGADALAMMVKTDFMSQKGISLVTDYGTNAEMALKVGDRIVTCSAAAGPAIEGQSIKCGMLAGPGAISDINEEDGLWRMTVLDEHMGAVQGDLVDPKTGQIVEKGSVVSRGITGTGVISAIALGISTGIIKKMPELPHGRLFVGEDLIITDRDVSEAGKAIGAIRAAHLTLLIESGLEYQDLEYMYMSGASGTYVDADKGRMIGLLPGFAPNIVQFGNTSLELAKDVVLGKYELEYIEKLAERIKADHLMLASNETFKNIYACELSYWTEGMSEEMYNDLIDIYGLPKIPTKLSNPKIERKVRKDIENIGYAGLKIIKDLGMVIEEDTNRCEKCKLCERECPEKAINIVERDGHVYAEYSAYKCLGMSCKRCAGVCPIKAIKYKNMKPVYTEDIMVS